MTVPTLVSVNLGSPRPLGTRKALSGIFKTPQPGAVRLGTEGVSGDAVLDTKHHGGPDQAVYLYLQSDYDWWSAELGAPLAPGTFGENLTVAGIDGSGVGAGDRFTIGDTLLEVTSHRTPCKTFADRMNDSSWVRRFQAAGRPGAYLRVLREGMVTAGDDVGYEPFHGDPVPVSELMALTASRNVEAAVLRRCLRAPLHHKMRTDFEARLARAKS